MNRAAADHLVAHRHTVLLWNAVPGDFRDPDGWVASAHTLLKDAPETVVLVLHDTTNGAMRHLDRFLGEAEQAGAQFGAEPPAACVPLRRGVASADFVRYVTQAP